jgi:hypothetical protein
MKYHELEEFGRAKKDADGGNYILPNTGLIVDLCRKKHSGLMVVY